MKIYYDKDGDLGVFKGKKVAIIGFGSQGHAQALNLRDSWVDVILAEMPGTPNYAAALKYKFKPVSAAEAAKKAQVVQILTQDHVQARLYENDLKPQTKGPGVLVEEMPGLCRFFGVGGRGKSEAKDRGRAQVPERTIRTKRQKRMRSGRNRGFRGGGLRFKRAA